MRFCKRGRAIISGIALFFLFGFAIGEARYLPQAEPIAARGAYLHSPSQITFPTNVGDFQRVSILRYDVDGLDVSAGYNLVSPSRHIAATVYVYPAPSLISIGSPKNVVADAQAHLAESEFENRKREIEHAHPNAVLIEQRAISRVEGNRSYPGKVAVYEYNDVFAGSRMRLRSQLYVFCYVGGKWAVEYRFSYPKSESADPQIRGFIGRWNWFGKPTQQKPLTAIGARDSADRAIGEYRIVNTLGRTQGKGRFVAGSKEGLWTFWDSHGTRIGEINYGENVASGEFRLFYGASAYPRAAGRLETVGHAIGGHVVGEHIGYGIDGKLISRAILSPTGAVSASVGSAELARNLAQADQQLFLVLDQSIRAALY